MQHVAHEAFIDPAPDCAGVVTRLPRNAGRGLIWIYRHTLSPLVGYNCRHLPTCSVYGDEAIERFGLWGGGWMTLARLLRCQPWGTSGIDNVPQETPPGARWYLPWRYGRWRGVNGALEICKCAQNHAEISVPNQRKPRVREAAAVSASWRAAAAAAVGR